MGEGARVMSGTGAEPWRELADLTANRLRLIQADLADGSVADRREAMASEVRAALQRVPSAERNLFLEVVESRFPGWEGGRVVTYGDGEPGGGAGPGLAAGVAPSEIAELNDPSFLVRQLVKNAIKMSEAERQAAGERLAGAGIAPPGVGEIPAEAAARVKGTLGMGASEGADPGRMLEAFAVMAEQVLSLDRLVWTTWQQMAPGSPLRRRQALSATLGKFVGGGGEVGREQMAEELGRFRQLTAAILATLAQAGEQAFRQMSKVSPEQVEQMVAAERKWGANPEAAAWKKYKQLAGGLDQSRVESEIIRAMAAFAEGLMR